MKFIQAIAFAWFAFKMYRRGWRTNTWHLPGPSYIHDAKVYQDTDGWQSCRHGQSTLKHFTSVWDAVHLSEVWAQSKRFPSELQSLLPGIDTTHRGVK